MEERLESSSEQPLNKPLSPQSLASLRSLIINPYTSYSTLSSVLETLTHSLRNAPESLLLHHTLKLLSDLASRHPQLSSLVIVFLRSDSLLSSDSPRLAAESLSALASITSSQDKVDDARFISLCFGPSVSVRMWLLRNAERLGVRESVLLTVFLGFTKDPYPCVRKIALDGLANLCKSGDFEDPNVVEGCYCRAIELLRDAEDSVRSAAVRAVMEWGNVWVASSEEGKKVHCSDAVFIQLCSMVRDMSMEVRLEAFDAIGKIGLVSEDTLLQTLSKKVLGLTKEKKSLENFLSESLEVSSSASAGAFVHGLEDEFYEVRKSACYSLRTLTVLSAKFAGEALNLLTDMLNDDSKDVRLQALETMHHMATFDHLELEEMHMHTFIGILVDNGDFIRYTARKILKVAKLSKLELFKLCIGGLLGNLEAYPQDEVDVFSVMFYIGRNHGNFAVCMIEEVSDEMEPDFGGKLNFDGARVTAFLVLAISTPLSQGKNVHVPSRIFSYAVTMLGRISPALSDVMNQETLLAYLLKCSRSSDVSLKELQVEELVLPSVESDAPIHTSKTCGPGEKPLQQIGNEPSPILSEGLFLRKLATSHAGCQLEERDVVRKLVNLVFLKVKDFWSLVQSGLTDEALKTLRGCKREVAALTKEFSDGTLAFILHYLRVVKLLAVVWKLLMPTVKLESYGIGKLELLIGKLDGRVRELRSRFLGLSIEEELQILDFALIACLLRLSKVEICCYHSNIKNLSSTVSWIEFLCKEASIEPSNFVTEVKKLVQEISTSAGVNSCKPFLFKKLLQSFSLKQFALCGNPRYVNAELEVPYNNSENPLLFIPGLPVSIPLEITLHNVLSDCRIWVTITMSEQSTQFVFLDLNLIGGSNEVRKFTYAAPFYPTPKADSFMLTVSIGMECLFEGGHGVKGCGGPKHEVVYICPEKEVYLSMRTKGRMNY